MSLFSRWSRRSTAAPPEPGPVDSRRLRGGRDARPNDVFIAIMGVTGSEKSSFISLCSGKPVKVGHQLEACTIDVDVYPYERSPDQTVYLIDTPGFDDTNRSDTMVLKEIAAWLVAFYKQKILLNGIIYLHRITDIRMGGSAKRNLIMFKQLCGQDALKKVILVTTMWDKLPGDEASQREQQLVDTPEFWGWMISKVSTAHRHNNTQDSARGIVGLLAGHNAPIVTDLQIQMVDEKKYLDQTSAGQELQSEILKERAKWAKQQREMEEQMKMAIQQRDRETEKVMREERDRYTRMIQKVESDSGVLKSDMNKLLADRDQRFSEMERRMRDQEAAHRKEMERINERQRRVEKEKAELEKQQRRKGQERRREEKRQAKEQDAQRRQQEQEAQAQARRRQAQSAAAAAAPPPPPATPKFTSLYSVTIANGTYACSNRNMVSSNASAPATKRGSATLKAASFGDLDSRRYGTWIANYSDGTWYASGLASAYSALWSNIQERGINNLELCSLGPQGTYFARWTDGYWRCFGSSEINSAIERAQSGGNDVKAIALGIAGSYVMSFGPRSSTGWKTLGGSWNLMGYYQGLDVDECLKGRSVMAVALDMYSGVDCMVVYSTGTSAAYRCYLSRPSLSNGIMGWWSNAATSSNTPIEPYQRSSSVESGILYDLLTSPIGKWGWVVYRCSYDDDKAWNRFKEFLVRNVKTAVAESDTPQLIEYFDLLFFEDQGMFEGATRETLRRHFQEWRGREVLGDAAPALLFPPPSSASTVTFGQLCEKNHYLEHPRFQCFIQVDDDAIRSMRGLFESELLPTGIGYVNYVVADWPPKPGDIDWGYLMDVPGPGEDELEEFQGVADGEELEPIDGHVTIHVG